MTEELINDLGQVSTLRVISLTSSMSYKGTKKNLPQIAHELSVDGVVEGGILRDGNQVRVSVQLIDAGTDRPIWAHTYVRDLNSVLPWQGEVAEAIAEEISTEVTPQEQARLVRKRSVDPEAQDFYLHGIRLREADECKDAIDFFNRAIARDPAYAEAHSALASCYGMLGESGRMPYEDAFSRQKAEALKAIELDESLSEAHAELANTAMTLDWDWPTAEAEFHRALQLNPNSAPSHEKYAFYLVRTGHIREAVNEIERSLDLDPVSGSTFHAEGFIYYFTRQYDQALTVTRTVQGLKINLTDWSFLLGDLYAEKGMYQQSIGAFLKSGDGPYTLGHLGNAYARAGQVAAAKRCISELQQRVKKYGVGRYEIALVYAGIGDKDSAFAWLEDAYRAHDVGLVYLKVDPCLDPLRSDPRFDDLLRRVGLSQ
ncbi:MAG: TPR end-of-group domain-containing protein [Terracidiphilus sp.]